MKGDVENFARRHPLAFFGGLFIGGLVVGNLLKARSTGSESSTDESDFDEGNASGSEDLNEPSTTTDSI